MEPQPPAAPETNITDLLSEISAGLEDYYRDRSRLEVWARVFGVIGIYVQKDGPIAA